MKVPRTQKGFTLIELLVVIGIIALLASIALPAFNNVQLKAAQTKALSNAKQVGFCCKEYAADNNGAFPSYTLASSSTSTPSPATSSNDALSNLFPTYLTTVQIFWLAKSAFCQATAPVDPNPATDTTSDALATKYNEWAYVPFLFDTSSASFPLLADGFASATTHNYSTQESAAGGVWKGVTAIVVFCDDSAKIVKTNGSQIVPGGADGSDLFEVNTSWLGTSNAVLNPN